MATIVKHRQTGERYLLLGTGFGAYRATKPNWLFGNLMADEQSGELSVVAVCNAAGEIGWFASGELVVTGIDGRAPAQVLGA